MAQKPDAVQTQVAGKPITKEFARKLEVATKEWEMIEEDPVNTPVSAGGHRRSRCTVIDGPPLTADPSPTNANAVKPK